MSLHQKLFWFFLTGLIVLKLLIDLPNLNGQTTEEIPFPSFSFPMLTDDLSDNQEGMSSLSTDPISPVSATIDIEKISKPPTSLEIPEFAKESYQSLENAPGKDDVITEEYGTLTRRTKDGRLVNVPPRDRQSIMEKEEKEKELETQYDSWVKDQKKKKKRSSVPRYLQPLSEDRTIFDDPNSPFSRKVQAENDRRFVRQVTAADLTLMKEVSSKRELMDWEKEQDMPIDWTKYSMNWEKWRNWLGMGPDEKEAIAYMQKACQKHQEFCQTKEIKKLREAAVLYEKAGKKWPDSVLEEDALFYAAECYFFEKNYPKALEFYRALVSRYSNSILKQDAMKRLYCIGCYWVQCSEADPSLVNLKDSARPRFSSFAGAKKAFETIYLNDASDRGMAPDALFALANAFMRRGVVQGDASFASAAQYYRQLYEFYPGSRHTDQAYQLAMLALYQSYRGPFYDDAPLKQAQEIAELAKRSGRKSMNIELIDERLSMIRNEQAKYLWARGEYYEKRGNYASARSYYNRLVKEYPDSELVASAIQRYNLINDKPAEADQFAYVRPIVPFLPKPKNEYFEERPVEVIQVASKNEDLSGLQNNRESSKKSSQY
ncbi:MAG: tetratricopeptide repeat protein [Planctomycetia bacterium]|nr:tetratricopeptide repeat protein [Planctomycetia bacterium]